ncbi:MAG: hypothetical protein ABIP03_13415 [Aquihabitans sp.]
MVTASATRERTFPGSRALLIFAGVILLATSAWFVSSRIDSGDATCGAAVIPTMRTGQDAPSGCGRTMALRATLSVVILAAGILLIVLGVGDQPMSTGSSVAILATALVVSVMIVLVNEGVRSQGLLALLLP